MKQILLIVGVSILLFSACGGNSSKKDTVSIILKPEQTAVKGDLSDYFEVVTKDYKIEKGSMFTTIDVELKRIGDDLPFDPDLANPFGVNGMGEHQEDYHVGFGIEILDENGNVIFVMQPTGSGFSGPYSSKDIENIIRINEGETAIVRWSVKDNVMKEGKTFRITSALKKERGGSSKKNKAKSSSSTSSSEWDKVLDSYEKYIDQYAKLYKKAQAGDMSALTEYASMLEKANDLSNKLEKAQNDMSTTQMARFTKLQAKLISAIQ